MKLNRQSLANMSLLAHSQTISPQVHQHHNRVKQSTTRDDVGGSSKYPRGDRCRLASHAKEKARDGQESAAGC
eukprot:41304-Hanusia_phi.AAC.1